MPIIDPDQGVPLPDGPDLANNPAAFSNFYTPVKSRLILRYPTRAARAAQHPAPILNETSIIDGETWYERWTGAKWLPASSWGAFKSVAQVVNNSAVLVNDTALTVPLPAANTMYQFSMGLRYTSNTTADIKVTFSQPAGCVSVFGGPLVDLGAGGSISQSDWNNGVPPSVLASGGTNVIAYATVTGSISTAAATGSYTLQWAQNTANASNTTVHDFSWIVVHAIS